MDGYACRSGLAAIAFACSSDPLLFAYCSDAALVAKTCVLKSVALELDEVTRVKDEVPYLYVFGRRTGKNVVVRFKP